MPQDSTTSLSPSPGPSRRSPSPTPDPSRRSPLPRRSRRSPSPKPGPSLRSNSPAPGSSLRQSLPGRFTTFKEEMASLTKRITWGKWISKNQVKNTYILKIMNEINMNFFFQKSATRGRRTFSPWLTTICRKSLPCSRLFRLGYSGGKWP